MTALVAVFLWSCGSSNTSSGVPVTLIEDGPYSERVALAVELVDLRYTRRILVWSQTTQAFPDGVTKVQDDIAVRETEVLAAALAHEDCHHQQRHEGREYYGQAPELECNEVMARVLDKYGQSEIAADIRSQDGLHFE